MDKQKGVSLILLVVLVLVLLGFSFIAWSMFFKVSKEASPAPEIQVVIPSPELISSPMSPIAEQNVYRNVLLGFEFDLREGERVAACEEGKVSNSYTFQATSSPKPEFVTQEIACIQGDSEPLDSVFVYKIGASNTWSSAQEYIEQLEEDYNLSKTPLDISGVSATKVEGSLKYSAPLPDIVARIVFEYKGHIFAVDTIYLERNFRLIP